MCTCDVDKGIAVGDTIVAVGDTSVVDYEHATAVALMQSHASTMHITVLQTSLAHPPNGSVRALRASYPFSFFFLLFCVFVLVGMF